MTHKKIRLKDIADMANVSVSSVSLVLSNPETKRISPEKRKEILYLAKKHNYVPNSAARTLVSNKSNSVGLIIPDLENPFFSTLAKKLEKELRSINYVLLIVNSDTGDTSDLELVTTLHQRNVDAILLATSLSTFGNEDTLTEYIKSIDIPVIILDRSLPGYSGSQILFDNKLGGYLATQHCLDQGHTLIGIITARNTSISGLYRYLGYVEAMKDYGIAIKENLISDGSFDFNSGYEYAEKLIDNGATAIICANDLIAFGVLKKAQELNILIPDNLAIIGYDNLAINDMLGIGLTSVSQDIAQLAKNAVQVLKETLKDPTYQERILLSPLLVVRNSVNKVG